ncbi:MAG: hypothetical protein QOK21_6 [Solirubrobacteraceae bacterium]|nr:hypothetical protein [Solirubrobacteraceae bacterium]
MPSAPEVPVPGTHPATVAVAPPCPGPACWAGAPSAARDDDGAFWLAYRRRVPQHAGRGTATVLARAADGERYETVVELPKERFGAESLERPALVRTPAGRWRLYVSCATPGSKHWRIDVLEASRPDALADGATRTAFAGDPEWGVKDPVIRHDGERWVAWVCCHPLAEPGAEDRMLTRFAISADGLEWTWAGDALVPRSGAWDARGTRVTAVLARAGVAYYDGRASAEQNFHERTGLAAAAGPGGGLARLHARGTEPLATSPDGGGALRYLDVVALAEGGYRLFYERARGDGAHELCTELSP